MTPIGENVFGKKKLHVRMVLVKKSDPDSFKSNPEEWRASLNFESSDALLIISSRFLVGLGPLMKLKSLF